MSGTDPIIGKKLGDYIIVDILGQGGMARVYRGIDKKLNRYAAVKIIDAHLIHEDQDEYRQRFQNEARAIARLNHPNIVGIYQFDQVGTIYYMAMNFIEGKDLRTILKQHGRNNTRMRYAEIAQVIYDIGSALDYAHSEGVIHRDIKPSNVMITNNGHRAILTDFGLALSVPEGTIGNTFGSAHYIAPEQAVSSAQAVPQSDIYSLGIVLFEMLTNRVPFNDPSAMAVAMKHLNDPPPPPSRVNPNIPPKVDNVVLKALDKDPKKRYPTGVAMAQALEAAFATAEGELSDTDLQIKPLPSWGDTSSSLSRPSRSSSSRPSDATGSRKDLLASWDGDERTATPRFPLRDDAPTVTDLKASAAARAQLLKDVPPRQNRRLWLIGGIALIIILGIAGLIAIITNNNGALVNTATATAEQTQEIALLPEASQTPEAQPTTPDPSPTAEIPATTMPTDVPTEQNVILASATAQPATAVSSATPAVAPSSSPVPTQIATDTPLSTTPPVVATDQPIILSYDDESLVLTNSSKADIDVSNLTFVQVNADGDVLDFDSSNWNQGNRPASDLPDGDCFQVMRDDLPRVGQPENCDSLQAWRRVSFIHWFWVSDDPNATFEVKRGNRVLATCSIAAGQCGFNPRSNG